ncbi:protein spire [Agrilus planipennis]|uniref:Protein spire n=1 Tax=Agrilus planipennis TaxID=224129 RepID=A0A1W4XLP9_AGRPL|nr:protein spire [Agrilus planipennis]XP_018333311.1 protein spire [Agrilus planipennis]
MSLGSEKCKVNSDGSVSLRDILSSFNSPIREEHAWALCYQCSKYISAVINSNPLSDCYVPSEIEHIYLQTDGSIHSKTLFGDASCRRKPDDERDLVCGLGLVIYQALDQGNDNNHERLIDSDLEKLITDMLPGEKNLHHETEDEGIEKDAEDSERLLNSSDIIKRCEKRLTTLTVQQVEAHYKAVVRALVAEALELSTFLERVAQSLSQGEVSNADLIHLQFSDWARFWMQVMAELRTGVKLKKVHYSKAPIEYELTPYEILMKDIRSCRYNLRKIMVKGDVPYKVTKDAHAIILEFIRSRPPLKKVSERKLAPPPRPTLTPREQLLSSIRKGRQLRPVEGMITSKTSPNPNMRKIIKVDFSQLLDDYDDVDENEGSDEAIEGAPGLWALEDCHQPYQIAELEPYDLATGGISKIRDYKYPLKRFDTLKFPNNSGSQSVPQSRPGSRQSYDSTDMTPEATKRLQESLTLEDRLSLTLQEIVHIRQVLTKAELDALPNESRVKSDVESRKVCFLCLKTRFSIFGPRGHRCTLCRRTVCTRCFSNMYIPMEHFDTVPVVLLSPSMLIAADDDEMSDSRSSSRLRSSSHPSAPVCHDCRMMIQKVAETAKVNMAAVRDRTLQNLSLNLSPVF